MLIARLGASIEFPDRLLAVSVRERLDPHAVVSNMFQKDRVVLLKAVLGVVPLTAKGAMGMWDVQACVRQMWYRFQMAGLD